MRSLFIKYDTRCRKCGNRLLVGREAFGEKSEVTGKWVFECAACNSGITKKPIKPDSVRAIKLEDFKAVVGSIMGDTSDATGLWNEALKAGIDALEETPDSIPEPIPEEIPEVKRSWLEQVRESAPWR